MEKAKAAISDFVSRSGHHDTTVHESVAPAVQKETVKPHKHENITTAVDKEIHQDHYHRSVQAVHDREVLPEKHSTKLGDVQHRQLDHRDHDHTKRNLMQDQAQFKDEQMVENTTSSRSVAPVVGGDHVHHHIHETIQPVIHKETIQPHVTHTTVPIHEVHHNKAMHHDATTLPPMTMDQFKSSGGILQGRGEKHDEFKGAPRALGSGPDGGFAAVRDIEHKGAHHSGSTANVATTGTQGLTGSSTAGGITGHHDGHHTGHHHHEHGVAGSTTTGGLAGSSTNGGVTGNQNGHHHVDRQGTGSNPSGGLTESSTAAGLSEHDHRRHGDRGAIGQGNMTGSSTQGGILSDSHQNNNLTSNRADHVTSSENNLGSGHHAKGVTDGVDGNNRHDLTHRGQDDGTLPKALTEERSKAVPHPEAY